MPPVTRNSHQIRRALDAALALLRVERTAISTRLLSGHRVHDLLGDLTYAADRGVAFLAERPLRSLWRWDILPELGVGAPVSLFQGRLAVAIVTELLRGVS